MEKKCKICKKIKSTTDFYKNGIYLKSYCKLCEVKKSVKWSKNNPEKNRAKARNWIKNNPHYQHNK